MQNNKSMLILVYQSDALFYELTGSYVLFGVVPWTMALTFCFLLGVIFARFIPCPHRLDLLRNPRIQEVFITWQSVRFLSRNSCFNQCQGLIFESVSLFKQNILISKCSRLTAYCSSKLFDIAIGVFFFQIRLYGNHGEKNEEQCFNIPLLFHYFVICSHSDANLDNGTIKEDDKAVLLEGGQSKSPSTKFRNLSTKANLIRYCLND